MIKMIVGAAMVMMCACVCAGDDEAPDTKAGMVLGAGTASCGVILNDASKNNDQAKVFYMFWAQGYLTGINQYEHFMASLAKMKPMADLEPDAESMWAYTLKYCNENPLNDFHNAVFSLVMELRAR